MMLLLFFIPPMAVILTAAANLPAIPQKAHSGTTPIHK